VKGGLTKKHQEAEVEKPLEDWEEDEKFPGEEEISKVGDNR
jgi:hypothetical protein